MVAGISPVRVTQTSLITLALRIGIPSSIASDDEGPRIKKTRPRGRLPSPVMGVSNVIALQRQDKRPLDMMGMVPSVPSIVVVPRLPSLGTDEAAVIARTA